MHFKSMHFHFISFPNFAEIQAPPGNFSDTTCVIFYLAWMPKLQITCMFLVQMKGNYY